MTSHTHSASAPSFVSTALPSVKVIELRTARQAIQQSRSFTKISISKMHCPKGKQEVLFWDPSCRGFGLRALKSGRRTWIYQYRDEHKRTRRIALGDASAVGLDAARKAARQHAASVTRGANPSVDRKGKKNVPSLIKVIDSYLIHAETCQRNARTKRPNGIFLSTRHLFITRGWRLSGVPTSRDCLTRCQRTPVPPLQIAFERRLVRSGPGACGLA